MRYSRLEPGVLANSWVSGAMDYPSQSISAHGVQISSSSALVVVVIKSAAIALILTYSRG